MPDIEITENGITKLLQKLNPQKANGPDKIPIKILKDYAPQLSKFLLIIFRKSYDSGDLPQDWLTANIAPIYKKGDKSKPSNYRPVSLTAVTCKVLEHIIHTNIIKHCNTHNIITDRQHGFRTQHSCESQLIITTEEIQRKLDKRKQVDMIILDFSKAFDTVAHNRLLAKLQAYGITSKTQNWICKWLKFRSQRVVIDGEISKEVPVLSGVPQGTVLGPLMFLLYINDISSDITSQIRLFADDCVLYREINSEADTKLLQKDLDKLVSWSHTWQMQFNTDKCHSLSIHRKQNPIQCTYTMENKNLTAVQSHPYLGIELQQDFKWTKQIENTTFKAQRTLNTLKRNLKQASSTVRSQAYKTLVRPQLEYASAVWDPYTKNGYRQN